MLVFGIENSGKANYYPRSFVGFVDYELSNKAPKISFIKMTRYALAQLEIHYYSPLRMLMLVIWSL